ncbi:lysine-N-methylase [Paenibacillus sp. GP183]|nr:lysine-N-methylase [Paenibacillus sp. GP183]
MFRTTKLIKMHLIGMAGFYKENINTDHVIKLIQSFAKTIEHNALYLRNVMALLKNNEVTTMAYMAIFIKN